MRVLRLKWSTKTGLHVHPHQDQIDAGFQVESFQLPDCRMLLDVGLVNMIAHEHCGWPRIGEVGWREAVKMAICEMEIEKFDLTSCLEEVTVVMLVLMDLVDAVHSVEEALEKLRKIGVTYK